MDLAKLDTVSGANKGFEVQLYDPGSTANLDIFVEVLGRDSAEWRRLNADHQRRRIAKMTKGGTFRMGSLSLEEIERESIELLASCTKSWRDGDKKTLTINGEEIPFSKEAAIRVYTAYPWIFEQVDAAVTDRANFIKRS
jgi:hypothetical protein